MQGMIGRARAILFKKTWAVGLILLSQLLVDVTVVLDIPLLRQAICFVYLIFVPGILIFAVLKVTNFGLLETILFAVGLDIAFLMAFGLLINNLLPLVGMRQPLSSPTILFALNIFTVISSILLILRGTTTRLVASRPSYHALLIVTLPILGILGVFVVNYFGNNALLLILLGCIVVWATLGTINRKILPAKQYALTIFAIALALLLPSSLVTAHLVGYDIHSEYYVFKLSDNSSFWNSTISSYDDRIMKGNAMLSVTILPTIFSKIADIDGILLFRTLYPLIAALIPVALFTMYSSRMKKEAAFFAAFFFTSNLVFFGTDGFPAKQMVGEYFFVLLFLVMLKKNTNIEKSFFFIFFSFGLVVSHYGMSYIFLFLIVLAFVFFTVMRFVGRNGKAHTGITLSMILIFVALVFSWYIYTAGAAPFNAIVSVGEHISDTFVTDFLDPSSRSSSVLKGVGASEAVSLGHSLGRYVSYFAEFSILVGVLAMWIKKDFRSIGKEYAVLSLFSLVMLIACIVVPNFAKYFRMERFLQVSLLFLAPFFVIGGEVIFGLAARVLRRKNQIYSLILVLIVGASFFLFETGFIYEMTEDYSYSLPLSMYRMNEISLKVSMNKISLYERITDAKEACGARWLSDHASLTSGLVYADSISIEHVLTSYGLIPGDVTRELTNATEFTRVGDYVYLRGVNTELGIMRGRVYMYRVWNLSDVQSIVDSQNLIYNNLNSEIMYVAQKTNSSFP